VHIFNQKIIDINALALKPSDFEALVLIRKRTQITEQLLSKLAYQKTYQSDRQARSVIIWI
jgi:hypothetical protein